MASLILENYANFCKLKSSIKHFHKRLANNIEITYKIQDFPNPK